MDSSGNRKRTHANSFNDSKSSEPKKGRSHCGQQSITDLASTIVQGKQIVMLSGSGLSVASGVQPFLLGANPSMQQVTATTHPTDTEPPPTPPPPAAEARTSAYTATRQSFREDPVAWYNNFWIPRYADSAAKTANPGHLAIRTLQEKYPNILQITQNVDGLQNWAQQQDDSDELSSRVIEAHGRVGLFKCVPAEDADSDLESDCSDDADEGRLVHLGKRRKSNEQLIRSRCPDTCPYQYLQSLHISQIEPDSVQDAMVQAHKAATTTQDARRVTEGNTTPDKKVKIKQPLRCPACNNFVAPQVRLSDEGYHSHAFYQLESMEDSLGNCDVLVFVGADLGMRLTDTALTHASTNNVPIYNFSLHDNLLESSSIEGAGQTIVVKNVIGNLSETLSKLVEECERVERGRLLKAENE